MKPNRPLHTTFTQKIGIGVLRDLSTGETRVKSVRDSKQIVTDLTAI
jgi:hypothetical protein